MNTSRLALLIDHWLQERKSSHPTGSGKSNDINEMEVVLELGKMIGSNAVFHHIALRQAASRCTTTCS
jgi:hypothetical protein